MTSDGAYLITKQEYEDAPTGFYIFNFVAGLASKDSGGALQERAVL